MVGFHVSSLRARAPGFAAVSFATNLHSAPSSDFRSRLRGILSFVGRAGLAAPNEVAFHVRCQPAGRN